MLVSHSFKWSPNTSWADLPSSYQLFKQTQLSPQFWLLSLKQQPVLWQDWPRIWKSQHNHNIALPVSHLINRYYLIVIIGLLHLKHRPTVFWKALVIFIRRRWAKMAFALINTFFKVQRIWFTWAILCIIKMAMTTRI